MAGLAVIAVITDKLQLRDYTVHMKLQLTHQVIDVLMTALVFLLTCYRLLGNVYIGDTSNNRIRKVTIATATSAPRYLSPCIQLQYQLLLIALFIV